LNAIRSWKYAGQVFNRHLICWPQHSIKTENFYFVVMVAVLRIQNIGLADVCICVPATQTPHVQEFHLPIYNCLSLMLEETFVSHWQ